MNFYKEKLKKLHEISNFRQIKPIIQNGKFITLEGKKLLNLSSNDYLSIGADDALREEFLNSYDGQISIPSARLLSGTNEVYLELENLLSKKINTEKTLLFNSGYHANVGIYSTLVGADDVVFCDKLNHASIIDGIKLGGAKLIPFKHLNYDDLREKLKKYRKNFKKAIISTESLFSMDGDFFRPNELIELKKEFNCLLIIDEAHSFGVFGEGFGLCSELNLAGEIDLIMATFGKAIGSYGAFCTGKEFLIDYLVNFSRPFIFSTVFPQISASFAKFVLEKGDLKIRAEKLQNLVKKIKTKSYIIPIILGENNKAVETSKNLMNEGFYTLPIRYPTVSKNTARIRISLNSSIEHPEIEKLFKMLYK